MKSVAAYIASIEAAVHLLRKRHDFANSHDLSLIDDALWAMIDMDEI